MTPPDVDDQLRLAGLRVTAPRRSVSQWLVEHPHATMEQIRLDEAEVVFWGLCPACHAPGAAPTT